MAAILSRPQCVKQRILIFLQQPDVLRELFNYLNPQHGPPPHNFESVEQTLKYLQACHNLFEKGFLSHNKIWGPESEVLANITSGYVFFVAWYNALKG